MRVEICKRKSEDKQEQFRHVHLSEVHVRFKSYLKSESVTYIGGLII